jgi:biopolymer transport protein ExbB/TolQ
MDVDFTAVTGPVGFVIYCALALVALWGAFCVIVVWRRVAQARFRSEEEQIQFLDGLEESLSSGDFEAAADLCDGDPRAMPQLAHLAIGNRGIGYGKVRALLIERFQRDVLSDLEYRLSWVYTVIKSAPMLGLLGTVVGMMGAFAKLGSQQDVRPEALAQDIMLALITTACGLTIAIPLVISTAAINVRIRKMEDLISGGLTRFLEVFKRVVGQGPREK